MRVMSVIEQLLPLLEQTADFADIRKATDTTDRAICVEGVSGAAKALLCAAIAAQRDSTALVLTYNEEHARQLAGDLAAMLGDDSAGRRVLLYPSIASALYDGVEPEADEVAQRLTVLQRLCSGAPTVVVTCVKAVLHLTLPHEELRRAQQQIRQGQGLDRDELAEALLDMGYERVDLVDDVGQFSVRGGIIDISPPTSALPVRIELFGDEVETIRHFDPVTQLSTHQVEQVTIGPAGELMLSQQAVRSALPAIRSAFRRELDQLNAEGKQREAQRLRERMEQDLQRLEQLHPSRSLIHYLPYVYQQPESILDYLPADAYLIVDEPVRLKSHGEQFESDVNAAYRSGVKLGNHLRLPATACMSFAKLVAAYFKQPRLQRPIIYLSMLRREVPWEPDIPLFSFRTPPVDSFGGKFELLVEGLAEWQREGRHVIIATNDVARMAQVLQSRGLSQLHTAEEGLRLERGIINIAGLDLSGGFTVPCAGLIVLSGREIYGWRKIRRPEEPVYKRGFSLTSLQELHEGDYVVHINHGIAVYRGLSKQQVGGMERDYLVLEYAEGDKLYVPVTQLDRVQKYFGAEGGRPQVTSLKRGRWERVKQRARRSARLLAAELMKLYSARERAEGFAFSPDGPWLAELESSFRYEETPDQWRAIEEVKADLEKPVPTDRLICGDVGFGKTEVAIRAAFKAVLDNKQVAVLVPTTVLAQQHYNTFRERLSRYPVEIAMLSRFKSRQEQQKIIRGLRDGTVDVVIGTHRLLSSDVQFKDLGLLIIDEEQRFGVKQKEQLKKLRTAVDVITLTATPIPRTLNMALSGIREISLINDPPQGRMPIRTYVRERDDALIREAIRRELARGGQVYFVHNRVQSISHVAAAIQRLVPEARVAVAHGQMPEADLEQVMLAFYAEEFDVLVCTTIIENGLDVPNVNTIIIDDAHKLGLAQLYQLRGRVGRSNRQAYAYLLYRYPERLNEEAEERLKAIEEFSELGSGFKLAMRDLEIRGAGDILGAEQSGHMSAVGLDLYCQMLADSVRALKGEPHSGWEGQPAVDLPVEAVIPAGYVPGESVRISLYRRIAACQSYEEIEALCRELRDRYGPMPRPVENLIRIARIKLACAPAGVVDISASQGRIILRLDNEYKLTERERRVLEGMYRPTRSQARRGARPVLPRISFNSNSVSFGYTSGDSEGMFQGVERLLELLAARARARGNESVAVRPTAGIPS